MTSLGRPSRSSWTASASGLRSKASSRKGYPSPLFLCACLFPFISHFFRGSKSCLSLCCSGSKRKPFISLDQFMEFLNRRQRDSRLNEVLYPPLKRDQVRQIMEKYETNTSQLERGSLPFHPPFPTF